MKIVTLFVEHLI